MIITIVTIIAIITTSIYLFLKYIFSYWSRKHVSFIEPVMPFGNMSDTVKGTTSFGLNVWNHYKYSNDPYNGLCLFTTPALLLRDPDLIRRVLVTDFNSFHDRGMHCNPEIDPLSENLFSLPGAQWKNLRQKLTPTFTSGKLKAMFPTILEMCDRLQHYMTGLAKNTEIVDINDLCMRYTIDIVSNVIFGYEVDSINNPDNDFREFSKKITANDSKWEDIKGALAFLSPKLLDLFKINPTPKFMTDFMVRIVKETIEYREKNNVQRKDFMQLLLQLRNTGEVKADGDWNVDSAAIKSMSIEQCASNVFLFYIAGNETTAATTSYLLHEITQYPVVLEKVLKEIDQVLDNKNGEITYDSLKEMKYLDLCVKETIRKYPALPILNRITTKEYQIPDSHLKLEKGTSIIISLMGLHRDENYFPNPDGFDPERFLPENKRYDERVYLPFGDGPRNCIGYRMGEIVAKCAIVSLLSSFKFENLESKGVEFEYNVSSVGLVPKNGIQMRVSLRDE